MGKWEAVRLTERMLAWVEREQAAARGRRVGRAENWFVGAVGEAAFAQWFYGDFMMGRGHRNAGKVDFPNGAEVKTSRVPGFAAEKLMSEAGAAERSDAVVFVQAVLPISAGEEPAAGMDCMLAGWEWACLFAGNPVEVRGIRAARSYGHAVLEEPLDMCQGMSSLHAELNAYREEFVQREGRQPGDGERRPAWATRWVLRRMGIGTQGLLFMQPVA